MFRKSHPQPTNFNPEVVVDGQATPARRKKILPQHFRASYVQLLSVVILFVVVGSITLLFTHAATVSTPPPAGGYFQIVPVGQFSNLPSDSQAASMVHYSTWEPRPENYTANHTVAPSSFTSAGYSGMLNHAQVFGRVDGNFSGTTDEVIQWAAAKWGLSDEIMRAEAVQESYWYQNYKDSNGNPVNGKGYGDFGNCGGSPAPSGYGVNGPASFGLVQVKWCTMKDASASGYDGWPWTENSTAYNLDMYGAVMRGCYEGWDTWLGSNYTAGDMWGCIGRWYAGDWYSPAAVNYINSVKNHLTNKEWLTWQDYGTPPTDTQSPTVSLTAPVSGTTVSGNSVAVTATATDNVSVSKVEFYLDNNLISTTVTAPYSYTWNTTAVADGTHALLAKAYDAAGNLGTSNTVTVTVKNIVTPPPPPKGDGLTGAYFGNKHLQGNPTLTRVDSNVNFNWGNGSPASSIAKDHFSVRWTGLVKAATTQTYTFYTRTDDGVRLWVNGQLLINDWRNHAATTDAATIALTAGQSYSIKMEYYENTGKAVAQLLWSTPALSKQVVPTAQLYSH